MFTFLKHFSKYAALAFLWLAFASPAKAWMPESGWWWNASESGKGYAIEIQDDQLFMATFAYFADGTPVWYVSAGRMNSDTSYSGRLLRFSGGWCFGCARTTPTGTDVGSVQISFTGSTDRVAQITLFGTTIPIKRFDFTPASDNTNTPQACYGEWSFVVGGRFEIATDAERLEFWEYYNAGNGSSVPFLGGNRSGSQFSWGAVCSYFPSSDKWSIFMASSSNFDRYFEFTRTGINRFEGVTWLVPRGGSLSGAGTDFLATRTASKTFAQTNSGPGTGLGPRTQKTLTKLDKDRADFYAERDSNTFKYQSKQGSVSTDVLSRFNQTKAQDAARVK
jgi:hypothetical protein